VPGNLRYEKKHVSTVAWTMGHYHADTRWAHKKGNVSS